MSQHFKCTKIKTNKPQLTAQPLFRHMRPLSSSPSNHQCYSLVSSVIHHTHHQEVALSKPHPAAADQPPAVVVCYSSEAHRRQTSVNPPKADPLKSRKPQPGLLLVEQEAGKGAVLPRAAIDGSTVQPQPHLVPLKEWQNCMVAGSLVIWGAIIGIRRHHHFFIAHEVNIEGNIDCQLQDVEDEHVCSVHWTGEPSNVGVVRLPQVAVQLVKHDGLVQVAWSKVSSTRGSERYSQRLGERVQLHWK